MSITIDEVKYIAALSKLRFTGEEEVQLAEEMNVMLDYMAKLNELNTDDIAPMSHVLDMQNVYRAETAQMRITHDEALKNAPDADRDYFRVPKVIG